FGITLLGILTAVGGGIIRDTMIGDVPTALTDPSSIYLSITVALIMYVIVRIKKNDTPREKQMVHFLTKTNLVFDSIGLAIFSL
ncbi:trimeric intracellular cation channel family protein, partial [Streptococcus pyogenes]